MGFFSGLLGDLTSPIAGLLGSIGSGLIATKGANDRNEQSMLHIVTGKQIGRAHV